MIRLFTGIKIPKNIASILSQKQIGLTNARLIEERDFHITICFIGDVDNILAEQIMLALNNIRIEQPIKIEIERLDIFGHKKPHALIAKIKENEALTNLRNRQQYQLNLLGIKMDNRKYIPHITLARFKKPSKIKNVKNSPERRNQQNQQNKNIAQFLAHNNFTNSLSFTIDKYCLFSAKYSVGGGPYMVEKIY